MVRFLRAKSDIFPEFKIYSTLIQRKIGKLIRTIHSDDLEVGDGVLLSVFDFIASVHSYGNLKRKCCIFLLHAFLDFPRVENYVKLTGSERTSI